MKPGAVSLMSAMAIVGLTATGCAAAQEQESSTLPKTEFTFEKEPQFAISRLSALPKATTSNSIPYLATPDGLPKDVPCYLEARQAPLWKTENPVILQQLKAKEAEIEAAIVAWSRDTLSFEQSFSFRARFEDLLIKHAPLEQVRLSAQQQCVNAAAAPSLGGARTIATHFGAKELLYESTSPIGQERLKKMEPKAKAVGCLIKARPYDYPQATDGSGKPLKDEKGRPQFKGPSGELLLKKDLPKPKNRPVFTWSLVCNKPVYFAVGDLQADAWSSEGDPTKCAVNLIFSDAMPRVPECPEFHDAGFGVEPIPDANDVLVKLTADGETVSKRIPLNERHALQVAGRVVVWVVPTPIEEGVLLSIDSVVLAPNSGDPSLLQSWTSKKNSSAKHPSPSSGR